MRCMLGLQLASKAIFLYTEVHMNTLYLTPDEQKIFSTLPANLREGWAVETEAGTAYEDDDVLRIRATMFRSPLPKLKDIAINAIRDKALPDPSFLETIPEGILPELYYTIGARGVLHIIGSLLPKAATDDDIGGLAGLTVIRHDILATNASIIYS